MKISTFLASINVENMKSAMDKSTTTIKNYLSSNTYTRELANTVAPYAKSAAILAIAAIVFKTASSLWVSNSQNYIISAVASLATGGVAGLVSSSYRQKIDQLTVIGIGLLANQILIPACLPMYCLSTLGTIFVNLIGVSLSLERVENSRL